jgi:putative restriction endonuclease
MPNLVEENSHVHTRALQAYLVLIGLAWNRQTITYGELSQYQMQYGQGGILAGPLGCIMGWCFENRLPSLTAIVVNSETGLPGPGLYLEVPGNLPGVQQQVFAFNWYSIFPPTVQELQDAGVRAGNGKLIPPA